MCEDPCRMVAPPNPIWVRPQVCFTQAAGRPQGYRGSNRLMRSLPLHPRGSAALCNGHWRVPSSFQGRLSGLPLTKVHGITGNDSYKGFSKNQLFFNITQHASLKTRTK